MAAGGGRIDAAEPLSMAWHFGKNGLPSDKDFPFRSLLRFIADQRDRSEYSRLMVTIRVTAKTITAKIKAGSRSRRCMPSRLARITSPVPGDKAGGGAVRIAPAGIRL